MLFPRWNIHILCLKKALMFSYAGQKGFAAWRSLLCSHSFASTRSIPFKTRLIYIFHVCVSAGCLKPVGSRAGASHQSKYFTFPACALCVIFALGCHGAAGPWFSRSRRGAWVGHQDVSHIGRGKRERAGALELPGVEVADEATGSGWE